MPDQPFFSDQYAEDPDDCEDCGCFHPPDTPHLEYCEQCDEAHRPPVNVCWCYECEQPAGDCICNDNEDLPPISILGIDVPNILEYRAEPHRLAHYYTFSRDYPDDPRDRLPRPVGDIASYRQANFILNRLTEYLVNSGILRHCRNCRMLSRPARAGSNICGNCTKTRKKCKECGSWLQDSTRRCDNCYRTYVHNYNYTASPKFRHSTKDEAIPVDQRLYTGVEIEVETGDMIAVAKEIDHKFTFTYLKHDGSLQNGFEIVTHPFTDKWLKENLEQIEDLFTRLYSQDAYIQTTCGTHFHLSMGAFSNTHLYKFMSFIYNNRTQMLTLSKRENLDWLESYASMTSENSRHLIQKAKRKANVVTTNGHRPGGKYVAVNLKDGRTVEVRIFAGCDSFQLFMGWYQFLHALYEYTKSCPFKNTRWVDFLGWLDFDGMKESKFPYLESLLSELHID